MDMIHLIIFLFLVICPHCVVAECSGGTIAGIVIGTMLGTLLVTAVVVGVIGFLCLRSSKTGQTKVKSSTKSYDNPSFQSDVELHNKGKHPHNGSAHPNDLPIGYVECEEYESPKKFEVITVKRTEQNTKARRNILDELDGNSNRKKLTLNLPSHQAGSHGSLDGAITPNDPEVISVSLQSQDIIGLGFNISGSMSEGIFVSQVHNRGPASESGQIKIGDRILSIQISMTNMVYEDALTILSYASPYAVRLRLQRAIPVTTDTASEDDPNINHPVYRSQSLDDLSKINKDKWVGPRKTWSEIKKVHPSKTMITSDDDSGKLRKWSNTDDIVHEEVGMLKSEEGNLASESKSTMSSLDMDIEPQAEITVHQFMTGNSEGGAHVIEVEIPQEKAEDSFAVVPDIDDHGIKRKSAELVAQVYSNINDSGVVTDAPPIKKLRDSISQEVQVNGAVSENDKLELINGTVNGDESIDHDVTVLEVNQDNSEPKFTLTSHTDKDEESVSSLSENSGSEIMTVSDINENKILLDKQLLEGKFIKDSVDLDNVSTEVHISESFINRNASDISLGWEDEEESKVSQEGDEKESSKSHDDSVRAVLKDYFGDQPTLLEQFGFEEGKSGINSSDKNIEEESTTVEITTTSTSSTKTSVEREEVQDEKGDGQSKARRTKDYQYNTGTKGGMAYYLRFDENFHDDFGLFNHEFSAHKEQPNFIPVPIHDVVARPAAVEVSGGFNSNNSNNSNTISSRVEDCLEQTVVQGSTQSSNSGERGNKDKICTSGSVKENSSVVLDHQESNETTA